MPIKTHRNLEPTARNLRVGATHVMRLAEKPIRCTNTSRAAEFPPTQTSLTLQQRATRLIPSDHAGRSITQCWLQVVFRFCFLYWTCRSYFLEVSEQQWLGLRHDKISDSCIIPLVGVSNHCYGAQRGLEWKRWELCGSVVGRVEANYSYFARCWFYLNPQHALFFSFFWGQSKHTVPSRRSTIYPNPFSYSPS